MHVPDRIVAVIAARVTNWWKRVYAFSSWMTSIELTLWWEFEKELILYTDFIQLVYKVAYPPLPWYLNRITILRCILVLIISGVYENTFYIFLVSCNDGSGAIHSHHQFLYVWENNSNICIDDDLYNYFKLLGFSEIYC